MKTLLAKQNLAAASSKTFNKVSRLVQQAVHQFHMNVTIIQNKVVYITNSNFTEFPVSGVYNVILKCWQGVIGC